MISTLFPIVAGTTAAVQRLPWLGVADVVIAFALVCTVIALMSRARAIVADADRLTAYRATLHVLTVVPVLLLFFFVVGDRVNWEVLLIGLAWRGWFLVQTLPSLAAVLREDRSAQAAG